MMQFLHDRKVALRVENLVEGKHGFPPRLGIRFQMLGDLHCPDFFVAQPELLPVYFNPFFFFFGGQVVPSVDDEVVLALDSTLARVLVKDKVHVDVKTHEFCQRLLPKEALCLKVHLGYGF